MRKISIGWILDNEAVKKIRVQVRRLKFISPASNNSIFRYKYTGIDDRLVDLPFYLTRISLVFLTLRFVNRKKRHTVRVRSRLLY